MDRLKQVNKRPEIEPEYYWYQTALVQGQLDSLQEVINRLQQEYPQMREYAIKQLRDELLAIEADTYAEFVRGGSIKQ